MSTKSISKIKDYWNGLTIPKRALGAVLSAREQTRSTWPRLIESIDSLPENYRGIFQDLFGDNISEFPYTIFAPSRNGFSRTVEKLICEHKNTVTVIERDSSQITVQEHHMDSIRDVEVGIVLLFAWMRISSLTEEGVLTTSTVKYNSVERELFARLTNKIRANQHQFDSTQLEQEKTKLGYLEKVNYKFKNYGQASILGSERIISSVFQPEFRYKDDGILGKLFIRSISTAHLVILTDKELILIQEDKKHRGYRGVRYGGIWQYIPLDSIVSASLTGNHGGISKLGIHISNDDCVERLFLNQDTEELLLLKNQIENLISGNWE